MENEVFDYSKLSKLLLSNDLFKSLQSNYSPQIKSFQNITYMSFHDQGYSFCFKYNVFDSIFYYNQNINHFSQSTLPLPYNLSFQMKNIDIVQKFGDTKKKGGGKCPIFLCYPHLGIEITFLNSDWNDLENPIIYLSQFNKNNDELYCAVCTQAIPQIEESVITCGNKCGCVYYCSQKCKEQHFTYHLKHCK